MNSFLAKSRASVPPLTAFCVERHKKYVKNPNKKVKKVSITVERAVKLSGVSPNQSSFGISFLVVIPSPCMVLGWREIIGGAMTVTLGADDILAFSSLFFPFSWRLVS
jgi:hypothetical protein